MAKASYHHGNLKLALINAALREIAHEGADGFSLRGVARRAGVSAPAVYRHFTDKDDLLAAVAAECAERLATAMTEAVAKAPDDPLERFRATGVAIVRFAVAHPEHFRALGIPDLNKRTPPEQRARELAWQKEEMRRLEEAQARGLISNVPLDDLLLTANSAVMGLAFAIINGRLGPVDDARATKLALAVTGILGVGLIPRDEEVDVPALGVVKPKKPKKK